MRSVVLWQEAFAKIKMRVLTRRWEKASQAPHNALELKELKLKHDEALAEQKALIAQLRNKDSNKLDEKWVAWADGVGAELGVV